MLRGETVIKDRSLQPSPLLVGLGTNSNLPCLSDRFGMVGKSGEMSSVGTTASLFNDCA